MDERTIGTIVEILEHLSPVTLAAIVADIEYDIDMTTPRLMADFRDMVTAMGESLVGENDFSLMVGQAYEYVA